MKNTAKKERWKDIILVIWIGIIIFQVFLTSARSFGPPMKQSETMESGPQSLSRGPCRFEIKGHSWALKARDIETYLQEHYPKSPLIGNVYLFFAHTKSGNRAINALAISGQESSFGTRGYIATECNNYFGYLYNYSNKERRGCGSPNWTTPEKGIKRFLELENDNWLQVLDFTTSERAMRTQTKPNGQKYCVTRCEHWATGTSYFYNLLLDL